MAVLCPMYDTIDGWYIIDKDGKKQFLSSLLLYYYSLGVNPPVGANITQSDIDDLEYDLFTADDNDNLDDTPLYPGEVPYLSENVNQAPSTSNWLNDLVNSIQTSSYAYPNQSSALMTDPHVTSYLSDTLALPLLNSKMAESEEMDMSDYEDEFEEDSIIYDYSSVKSSKNSIMTHSNNI